MAGLWHRFKHITTFKVQRSHVVEMKLSKISVRCKLPFLLRNYRWLFTCQVRNPMFIAWTFQYIPLLVAETPHFFDTLNRCLSMRRFLLSRPRDHAHFWSIAVNQSTNSKISQLGPSFPTRWCRKPKTHWCLLLLSLLTKKTYTREILGFRTQDRSILGFYRGCFQ